MRFAAPEFLWLLLLVPLWGLVGWAAHARREGALRRFAGGESFASRFTGEVCRKWLRTYNSQVEKWEKRAKAAKEFSGAG